jgi:hypothetical protein
MYISASAEELRSLEERCGRLKDASFREQSDNIKFDDDLNLFILLRAVKGMVPPAGERIRQDNPFLAPRKRALSSKIICVI